MSILEIVFVIVAFLANIIQSITGFAGTVLAMPFSIRLVGYDVARPILNLVAIAICLVIVIFNFKKINIKKLLFLLLLVGIGFDLGLLIDKLDVINDKELLLSAYGTLVCMIAIFLLLVNNKPIKLPIWSEALVLVLAGIIHYFFTSGGPLVVIFAAITIKDKNEFRATLSVMWIILNSITFGINIADGLFTPHVWILSMIVIGTSLLTLIIGRFILKKINQKAFLTLAYILMFISGFAAIV